MWLDVLAFAALAGLSTLGLVRGTLSTGLRIASLIAAYWAAVIGSSVFAELAAAQLNVPRVLGMAAAGSATFIVAWLGLGVVSKVITSWEKRRRRGAPRTAADRAGGALLGAAQGAILVVLIGWLGLWMQAGRASGGGGALEALPDTSDSRVPFLTQVVVETGAAAILSEDDTAARAAIRAAVRPAETISNVSDLASGPRMRTLQQDRLFWSYVENGAIDTALNRGSFLGAAYDSSFRRQLFELGLINDAAASDPRLFRNKAREVLMAVSPRIKGLRDDPELRGLMDDPEIAAAISSGDTMALLTNARFRRVLRNILDGPPEPSAEPLDEVQAEAPVPAPADEPGFSLPATPGEAEDPAPGSLE